MSTPLLFLVDRRDPGTLREWLAHEGQAVAHEVAVVTYQELLRRPVVEAGVCVLLRPRPTDTGAARARSRSLAAARAIGC